MDDKTTWVEKKFKIYEPGKFIPSLNRIYSILSYKRAMEDDRTKVLMEKHMFPLLSDSYISKRKNDPDLSTAAKLNYELGKELGMVTDWKIGEITAIIKPKYVKTIDDLKIDTAFHWMIGRAYTLEDDPCNIIHGIKVISFYLEI